MTYEKLEYAMEQRGYNIAGLTPEQIEAIAEVEGFKRHTNGKYYYRG